MNIHTHSHPFYPRVIYPYVPLLVGYMLDHDVVPVFSSNHPKKLFDIKTKILSSSINVRLTLLANFLSLHSKSSLLTTNQDPEKNPSDEEDLRKNDR